MEDLQFPEFSTIFRLLLSAVVIYVAVIAFTRLFGLRSFSKMSSFDFAMTVAIGSILASTIVSGKAMIVEGTIGLFFLYALQFLIAWLREKSKWVDTIVDNTPKLLMLDGEIIESNLAKTHVRREDIYAKLREANVVQLKKVRAVVLETTGDISVLTSEDDSKEMESWVLKGVER